MNQEIRRKVLCVFKDLHRMRQTVFQGDTTTLSAAREKINSEFCKHKNETSVDKIEELIAKGQEVAKVLSVNVIQAEQHDSGMYKVKLRPEVVTIDNNPYTPMPDHMIGPFKKKKTKCQEDS
ncbi:hypothetical protein Pmani_031580 [Petrolisthes manimaculis]|uniref:Complex III assembly factor LYRM7 n=1 Tax=Petrolisthes manimaculis TaxID=1843537 RepID=A0AAE1TS90_9EUCA|nr:hypothetical protein Pmani_031580 [Petrolisthes manimaculis]